MMALLHRRGAIVSYTDPLVPALADEGRNLESVPFDDALDGIDCAVVATDHTAFDYARIVDLPLVVDTRNALAAFKKPSIYRL